MKIVEYEFAPFRKRLRMYLCEKEISIERVVARELTKEVPLEDPLLGNPLGGLPALVVDDGSVLSEPLAVVEYLEEIHPVPSLFGSDPIERAHVRALDRTILDEVLPRVVALATTQCATLPPLLQPIEDQSALVANLASAIDEFDAAVSSGPFVAGHTLSIADCTLFATVQLALVAGIALRPENMGLVEWYATLSERASARA